MACAVVSASAAASFAATPAAAAPAVLPAVSAAPTAAPDAAADPLPLVRLMGERRIEAVADVYADVCVDGAGGTGDIVVGLMLAQPSTCALTKAAVRSNQAAAPCPLDQSRSAFKPLDNAASLLSRKLLPSDGREGVVIAAVVAVGGVLVAALSAGTVGESAAAFAFAREGLGFGFAAPGRLFAAATLRLFTPAAGSGCFSATLAFASSFAFSFSFSSLPCFFSFSVSFSLS